MTRPVVLSIKEKYLISYDGGNVFFSSRLHRGGVYTPGAAFLKTSIRQRLEKKGIHFVASEESPKKDEASAKESPKKD